MGSQRVRHDWSSLAHCVGFCHTSTWISHTYTHVPCLLNLPTSPPPIPLPKVVTEHQDELPVLYSNFPLAIYVTHCNVYISMLLSQLLPPSPSPAESTSLPAMFLWWSWPAPRLTRRGRKYCLGLSEQGGASQALSQPIAQQVSWLWKKCLSPCVQGSSTNSVDACRSGCRAPARKTPTPYVLGGGGAQNRK